MSTNAAHNPENPATSVAIVGGGQAGLQTAASLREHGFTGAIDLYCDEAYLPYQRPPLSKTYLKEDSPPDKMYFRPQRYFDENRIDCHIGARVVAIDRGRRTLTMADGREAGWDRLVLTTGVVNRRLPVPGADLDGVVGLRGIDDAHVLRPRIRSASRIVIAGGGVIGLEVAAMARGLGVETVVVELGDRLAGRIGTAELSAELLRHQEAIGTRVVLGAGLSRIEGRDGKVAAVHVSTGEVIETGLVLVCIGVMPNVDLAKSAGLTVEDGILVDPFMQTSDPAILAAGDCTRFTPPFGTAGSLRLESVQNAIDQAKCAAATIVGKPAPYDALPWFWSDQGDLKLQIAGLVGGCDQVVVKADPAKPATTYYCFADGRLIGVECVNRPADFMAARRVLAQRKAVSPEEVAAPGFELKRLLA